MSKQGRVIVWCSPRTLSTVFTVCMSNIDDVEIISQPFLSACLVGPDAKQGEENKEIRKDINKITENMEIKCKGAWDSEIISYKYAKDILEAEYPDKKVVFVKDMSSGIIDQLDMLPKGYRHAFLIRKPEKVFLSMKKILKNFNREEELILIPGTGAVSKLYGFGESFLLYDHLVKTGIEPKPFIMDADDLVEHPESLLRQFCTFANIEYTDKLLAWEGGEDVFANWQTSKEMLQWNTVGDWHSKAFTSKTFTKSADTPQKVELPVDVVQCIEASLPYYEKLYELRARIN